DLLVALLRVALGLCEIGGPRESLGEPARDERVELLLERGPRVARRFVERERYGDAGPSRRDRREARRAGAETLRERGLDLVARICSMLMSFASAFLSPSRFPRCSIWSTRRVTIRTSGWMPFSIFMHETHAPQPPAIRGSAVQFSVCANRSATVFLPIDRGP